MKARCSRATAIQSAPSRCCSRRCQSIGRADALSARSVRAARQAPDGRHRKDRHVPRSDHRRPPGRPYWTPNGNHRLQALKKLGHRAVMALLVSDANVAFKILALNTEKAHNLREKSLETIRMARALAGTSDATEGELRLRVRAGAVSHARRRLRSAPAPERRRLPVDSAPHRLLPRRRDQQGPQGTRTPRQARAASGRRGQRGRGEAEEEGAHQSVPALFRRVARELHTFLEGADDRLR